MSGLRVMPVREERGFTFAEVVDEDGKFAGRVVHVGPSGAGTWRPDAALLRSLGERPPTWHSFAEAKAALEGGE